MMNTKLLAVATPPSIYHGCSNWKTFWEEKFTGRKDLFLSVNMKTVVVAKLGNTRRSRIVTISPPWTYHKSLTVWTWWKPHLKIRKGVGNRSGFHNQSKVARIQKGKVYHWKCQWKGPFKDYQREWENWETTLWEKYAQTWANSQLLSSSKATCECMMRSDVHNRHVHGSYVEETDLSSNVNVTDKANQRKSPCTKLYRRINIRT